MTENMLSSDVPKPDIISSRIDEEMRSLNKTKIQIASEKIGCKPLLALAFAVVLNIWAFWTLDITYLVIWISASLYFYLFYPMLPIFLFPLRYFTKKPSEPKVSINKNDLINWARDLKIFKNKRIGFRLFMRFFILSLLPLTIGMICIYLMSVFFSLYLGNTGVIPADTSALILVQCIGIILFYIEIFFFRHHLFNFAEYVRRQKSLEWKKLIILSILGFIFLIVGTIVVFLLLIAILLPGFTLSSFMNVAEFVRVRTDVWIFIILISQFIIMQFLQSVLSLRISLQMCNDLIFRLNDSKKYLNPGKYLDPTKCGSEDLKNDFQQIKVPLRALKETELYAFNRRQMFGLFPTYSIGVNISNLFNIKTLNELKEVFISDD